MIPSLVVVLLAGAGPHPEPVGPFFPGVYRMDFGGTQYEASFGPDGSYACTSPGGGIYVGSWSFDPECQLLVVTEASRSHVEFCSVHGYEVRRTTWRMTLDRKLSGFVDGEGFKRLPASLVPVRKSNGVR